MTYDMAGKVALVTGGSSGIGKATALAFAREGACVIIASRDQARGEAALKELLDAGGLGIWLRADVTSATDVEALVQRTIETYGRLDFAFNNAGSGGMGGWLADQDELEWDKTIDGYLKSVYLCMKYELRAMLKAGAGSIVNNSSVDGKRAFPWDPVYSAAKHGVLGLTKSAANQYADHGIRINAVCPGWILMPPVEDMLKRNPDAEKGMLMHLPNARLGKPEEVAEAVVWLCSERASLIVGAALAVDGGYLIV